MLWDKLAQLAQVAALTTLARLPMETAMQDLLLFDIGKRVLQEIAAVAQARKVAIDPALVETKLALAATYPPNLYASMYHDLVAGKKLRLKVFLAMFLKPGNDVPSRPRRLIWSMPSLGRMEMGRSWRINPVYEAGSSVAAAANDLLSKIGCHPVRRERRDHDVR